MARHWSVLTKAVMLGTSVCGVLYLGWLLGGAYGERQVRLSREVARAKWVEMMAVDSVGIAIGRPFPSIPVWNIDGSSSFDDVRAVLPQGGVLVAVSPSCQACIEVSVALQTAIREHVGPVIQAAIMLEGEESVGLSEILREKQVSLPIYRDAEQRLIHDHHVIANPTHFVLDSAGIVRHLGAGMIDAEGFEQLFSDASLFSR